MENENAETSSSSFTSSSSTSSSSSSSASSSSEAPLSSRTALLRALHVPEGGPMRKAIEALVAQLGVALPYCKRLFGSAAIFSDLDEVVTGVDFAIVLSEHVAKLRGGGNDRGSDATKIEAAGTTLLRVISYCMGYDTLGKPIPPHSYLISGAAERAHVDRLRRAALAWVKLKDGRANAIAGIATTLKDVVCEALKENSLYWLQINTAKLNELRSRIRHPMTLFIEAIGALGHLDSVGTAYNYAKCMRKEAHKYIAAHKNVSAGYMDRCELLMGETILRLISYCLGVAAFGKPLPPHYYLIASGDTQQYPALLLRKAALEWVLAKKGRTLAVQKSTRLGRRKYKTDDDDDDDDDDDETLSKKRPRKRTTKRRAAPSPKKRKQQQPAFKPPFQLATNAGFALGSLGTLQKMCVHIEPDYAAVLVSAHRYLTLANTAIMTGAPHVYPARQALYVVNALRNLVHSPLFKAQLDHVHALIQKLRD